jgi:hypothetical protein
VVVQPDDAAGRLGTLTLLEPGDHVLEAGEPAVDATPPGCDELREERDVLDPLPTLALDVAADALQTAEQVLESEPISATCSATGRTSTRSAS